MAGAEGYQMEAAVLAAPVVKDREVLRLRRDAAGRRDVTGLVRTIVAATAAPADSTTRAAAAGAFNVLDLGEVARLFAAWRRWLRGVRPYYAVNAALARHFGGDDMPAGVEVIAEPGRYFAETTFALAARIFGKRTRGENYVPRPAPVTATADDGGEQAATMGGEMVITSTKTHPSTVFGPTLDSFDEVVRGYQLPELCTGDWLVFDDVGAYTTVCSSDFNGFSTSNMKTYLAYSC
uniref:Orn/DAP/Arg decarboxylase 2 C-terminal domain-containing protein n=1 Tax=Oryza barthii TaxID=65489 RepID=A0A0D3F571_9ORYZ